MAGKRKRGKSWEYIVKKKGYDCENKLSRTIYEAGHSESMGKGKTIYVNPDPDKLETVSPGSTNEILWKTACGKR